MPSKTKSEKTVNINLKYMDFIFTQVFVHAVANKSSWIKLIQSVSSSILITEEQNWLFTWSIYHMKTVACQGKSKLFVI